MTEHPGEAHRHDALAALTATRGDLRRALDRLAGLRSLDAAIIRGAPLAGIASDALRHVRLLVPAGRASVIVYDHLVGTCTLLAVDEDNPGTAGAGTVFPLEAIVPAELLAVPATRVYAQMATELADVAAARMMVQLGYRAACWSPMVADGVLVGMLALVATEAAAFSGDATEVVSEVAGQLAVALRAERDRETATRAAQRLRLLHLVDRAILDADTMVDLAGRAAALVREMLDADRVVIARYEPALAVGYRLASAMAGEQQPEETLVPVPLDRLISPAMIERPTTMVMRDLAAAVDSAPGIRFMLDQRLVAGVFVPLVAQGALQGGLIVGWRDSAKVTDEHVTIAVEVADQLAVAIRSAEGREQLAERERRLAVILEASPNGILAIDRSGTIQYANPSAHRLFGAAEGALQGHSHGDLIPAATIEAHPALIERWFEGSPAMITTHPLYTEAVRLDGATFPVHVLLARVETATGPLAIATVVDLSEPTALEARLRQAERLETLGQFAGILAHDVRNHLAAVSWSAELLEADLAPDDPRLEDVALIRRATTDAIDMTRTVLEFARPIGDPTGSLDIAAHLAGSRSMLVRILGEGISLRLDVAPGLPPAGINATAMTQVLGNLASNARDAMPSGGSLRITARLHEPGDTGPEAGPTGLTEPGRSIRLLVVDTGVGMDEDTRHRAFEAFYTTKTMASTARGTGLGLSSVFLIVTRAGGSIRVESVPGEGTTFALDLPVVDGAAGGA